MKVITALFEALVLLAAVYFLANAFLEPRQYNLVTASAVQVTQVYSVATYYAMMAVAFFAFTILLEIARRRPSSTPQS